MISVKTYLYNRSRSFYYAGSGIKKFFKSEPNAPIHLVITLIALGMAVILKVNKTEAFGLLIVTSMVWTTEIFNTAIEKICDRFEKNIDTDVAFIKDVSAAAVLISSVVALISGIYIFYPKIFT